MDMAGWAAAAVAGIWLIVFVVGYTLDQVPGLSAKAERAIASLRRLRAAWRDGEGTERHKQEAEGSDQERIEQRR
ncbi:hypothetical protein PV367_22010 [Streptomyces europaeiscabiei]|uniref:Uncharacterized protein n=1 Tax=Streptomyces europaeiscabiei TaxID=146819 RepID=A0AAJ2PRP8_9ACTN|nr:MULTISPECIES: hypothetical protein [Streptomyces]KFF96352.1 hypothetical protein IQ62_36775 [Streptomyces scabiei]MDX3132409.1 hypothetical protein [Streptomyces europaeiscabiei]